MVIGIGDRFPRWYGGIDALPSAWNDMMNVVSRRTPGTIFVHKEGWDTNTGWLPQSPKNSINGAITAINNASLNGTGAIPSSTNRCKIVVMDAGVYFENVVLPDYVDLFAPDASLKGVDLSVGGLPTLVIGSECSAYLYSVAAASIDTAIDFGPNSAIAKITTGWGFVNARHVYGGSSGIGVVSLGASGALHAHINIVHVPAGGLGVGGGYSTSFGHLHIYAGDIYFEGDGAIGVIAAANSSTNFNVVGHVEHMLSAGGPWTGTVAFAAIDGDGTHGKIDMSGNRVAADILIAVDPNSYARVLLSDGRLLGAPANGAVAGTETVTLTQSDGTTAFITLADLKTYMNAP